MIDQKYVVVPSPGKIVVKLEEVQTKTKSGIILVSNAHEPPPTVGTITAVAPEAEANWDMDEGEEVQPYYKVGDVVVFGKFVGSRLRVDRDTFIILREGDVLAVLVPAAAGADLGADLSTIALGERSDDDPI